MNSYDLSLDPCLSPKSLIYWIDKGELLRVLNMHLFTLSLGMLIHELTYLIYWLWVIVHWSMMSHEGQWGMILILIWSQLRKVKFTYVIMMLYLIVLLWCWWQGSVIPNPRSMNWLWSVWKFYDVIILWLNVVSYGYNVLCKVKG